MDLRRLVRGVVPWDDLERVACDIQQRSPHPDVRIEFLEADNWLSTPCVVDDEWFVKILTRQNAIVHGIFTGARNLGAVSSGSDGFFEHFTSPYEMAVHELEATHRLREIGVNAPEPVEAFEVGDFGVIVLEYLPSFHTLADSSSVDVSAYASPLFETLATMHRHNLAHGDLRGENVLIYEKELYFIDATKVSDDGIEGAIAYDLASALATLAPVIGAREAVSIALKYYSTEELLAARDFIDIVGVRPDHEFNAGQVKGEVEKRASRAANR